MVNANTDDRQMAKQQRSTQLPPDIFRLTDDAESATGAKFNRQVLAALLKYFCSKPDATNRRWMEAAVAVEKGQIGVGDVGLIIARENRVSAQLALQALTDRMSSAGHPAETIEKCTGEQRKAVVDAALVEQTWQAIFDSDEDPIKALIQHRKSTGYSPQDIAAFKDVDDDPESQSLTFRESQRPKRSDTGDDQSK